MTKSALIETTISTISVLPIEKVEEVAEFADFVLKRHEESVLQKGIEQMVQESDAFAFLTEEDLYTTDDLKVRF